MVLRTGQVYHNLYCILFYFMGAVYARRRLREGLADSKGADAANRPQSDG